MEGFQILIRLLISFTLFHSISGCCLIKVFYVTLYPPGLYCLSSYFGACAFGKKKKLCNKKPGPVTKVCSWLSGLHGNPLQDQFTVSTLLKTHSKRFHILQPCVLHSATPQLPHIHPLVSLEVPQLSHLYIKNGFQTSFSLFIKYFIYLAAVGHSCSMQNLFSWGMRICWLQHVDSSVVTCRT